MCPRDQEIVGFSAGQARFGPRSDLPNWKCLLIRPVRKGKLRQTLYEAGKKSGPTGDPVGPEPMFYTVLPCLMESVTESKSCTGQGSHGRVKTTEGERRGRIGTGTEEVVEGEDDVSQVNHFIVVGIEGQQTRHRIRIAPHIPA